MRQVPHYTVVGNGKMAKHFCFYLDHLGIPYSQWFRGLEESLLQEQTHKSSHVLFLISDSSIDAFIKERPWLSDKVSVHFSGALLSPYAHGAHPLHTFSKPLYDFEIYKKVPFILEKEGPDFTDLLPGLPNLHFKIPQARKAYYHSLCVLANNFTSILWQKFFSEMKEIFSIDSEVLQSYLEATFYNLKIDYKNALTGPLQRKDRLTLNANMQALKGDDFEEIFREFIKLKLGEEI